MFRRHRDHLAGQGLVEYAVIIVLVAVVVIGALSLLGPFIANMFDQVVTSLAPPPLAEEPPPPECYGTLLLPIMMAVAGLGIGLSYLFPRKQPAVVAVDT
jgi:pilus assembly protein Flp/PilA